MLRRRSTSYKFPTTVLVLVNCFKKMKNLIWNKKLPLYWTFSCMQWKAPAEIKWIEINASYTLADHHFIFCCVQKIPSKHIWWWILLYWQDLDPTIITLYTLLYTSKMTWCRCFELCCLNLCVSEGIGFAQNILKSRIFAYLYGMYIITIQYMYHHIISCSQEYDS